jgi:putative aminopeptidase FrvX
MARSAIRPDNVLRLARRTLSCPTAPYREGEVIAWLREFSAARPHLRLREDADGNVSVRRRGVRASRAPLVLAAHMDHPGFRVEADFLGGVPLSSFAGARARFFHDGEEIRARVERAALDRRSGRKRVVLRARRPVPAGAYGMWDLPAFRYSPDRDLIESRAVDDLAGLAAILSLLDAVDRIDRRRRVDVRGLFTRAEEVGFVGALSVAAGKRLPRAARIVAIEASMALPDAPQGAGPIVRVGDRTSVFDDRLTRWIAGVGARLAGPKGGRFTWQRKLMDGGTCESTAYQLFGYRCAGMCLPLGNYHNVGRGGRIAPESIRCSDLVGLVRFFEGLVREDGPAPAAGDPLRKRLGALLARSRRDLARDPFA